jgi:tRNA A37 methylthiotransferase MiaB
MLILYNPPSNAQRKPILPMSLLALGSLLEGHHDHLIVDGNLVSDPMLALEQAIQKTGTAVLGVTVMPGPQLANAVPTCRELKRRYPALTIVWGGYFPTQHWDVCLRAPYVDYVVRGHGEVVFKELLDALSLGEDPSGLPGLAWKTRTEQSANGEWANEELTINHSPLAPIPHPDRLPDFSYHRVDVERYVRPTFLGSRTLPHHSSYGCPFFCNFCAVVNMVNGRWLAQSAERTANTARQLVERWAVNAVEFYDNNFFTSEARVAEFAQRILDLDIAWWGEARIDTMLRYSERTWALLRDSGLKMVFLGAESGSDETLRRMNKGGKASTEKTLDLARQMAHYGIIPEMSFVMGNPPDPEADVRQTMTFIRQVKKVNPATEVIMYMYTPVPLAGELYQQAKAQGFRFPESLEDWIGAEWQDFSQRRSKTMPWIKDPLRRQVEDFERVLNAYYPTSTNPSLRGAKRSLLRTASAWRYRLGFYRFPVELRALHKLVAYQRPETTGF